MATKTYNGTRGYSFQWKIENISHCWIENGKEIESPTFDAEALEETKWSLQLYPSGLSSENFISFFLHRKGYGPEFIEVNYQLAILDKNGSILKEKTELKIQCEMFSNYGFSEYEEKKKVFSAHREAFLPGDTFTVQCTLWNTEEKPVNLMHLHARTVFEVKRRSFVWRIDKFSNVRCGLKNKFKDELIHFNLVFHEGLDSEKKLALIIKDFDKIKYFSFRISLMNSDGERENWGTHEYFTDDLNRNVPCTLLFTRKLMEHQSRYLPNDVLTLDCEYTSSNGTVAYKECVAGIIIYPKLKPEVLKSVNEHKESFKIIPALENDLKTMYNDRILSDMELRTSTQTFLTHKSMLSARSPVFRKMFNNDMKEKNCGHVDINDLKDDTVHRMLLYIYTDNLNDLQFEAAIKLYVAADKYEILSLRKSCSSFLRENLCPAVACDVLVLADRHHDSDLKGDVQDFILNHDNEVFGSQEWKHFMTENIQLASEIMYLFTQRKIGKL